MIKNTKTQTGLAVSQIGDAISSVARILAENTSVNASTMSAQANDFESLGSEAQTAVTLVHGEIELELGKNPEFMSLLSNGEGLDTESFAELATNSALAVPNMDGMAAYFETFKNKVSPNANHEVLGADGPESFDCEGFDSNMSYDFKPLSVVMNAIASKQSRLGEAWFPTKMLSAKDAG